jgi:hypothetical protein
MWTLVPSGWCDTSYFHVKYRQWFYPDGVLSAIIMENVDSGFDQDGVLPAVIMLQQRD